jgi:uncharacterized protein YbaP (TraB family)
MTSRIRLLVSALVLLFFWAHLAADSAPAAKNFMWKVQDGKNEVYILGSLHMLKPGFYPLPREMEEAFEKAQALVVEVDETKGDTMAQLRLTVQRATYPGDETLNSRLSPKTKEAFEAYLAKSGKKDNLIIQKMRPWFASLTILMEELHKAGFNPREGIDRHFLAEAKSQKKEILQLETADFQIKLLSDFSEDLQDKLLLSTLVGAGEMEKEAQVLVDAWQNGDEQAMNEAITKNERECPELEPVQRKILYERNGPMTDKIEGYLKSGGTYFVVVGAGHLVGDKGIIELLRKRKYKVEQIKRSPARKVSLCPESAPGLRASSANTA